LFYASDLFRRQFNIGFELRGFVESDRQFDESIEHTLRNMKDSTNEDDGAIHIGVTVDPNLTWHWKQRTHIGYAYSLLPEMVVVSQPILPGLGNWSSIEEAITLVHELGHIFGAVHASSGSSVMHSTSGSMALLFDKLNENIIDSMKTGFMSESRAERFEHYLRVLSLLRKLPDCKNTAGIIAYAANAAGYLQWADNQQRHPGSLSTSTDGAGAALKIDDLAMKDAIDGYIQYKQLNYDKAAVYFAKSVDEDPDFGEARVYYYLTLEKLGKTDEAAPQLKKANQMHMAWLVDEK
jgi:tetratricopeptide (TPR) repeat protein